MVEHGPRWQVTMDPMSTSQAAAKIEIENDSEEKTHRAIQKPDCLVDDTSFILKKLPIGDLRNPSPHRPRPFISRTMTITKEEGGPSEDYGNDEHTTVAAFLPWRVRKSAIHSP